MEKVEGIVAMIIFIVLIPIILAIVGAVLIIRGIIRWRKHKKKGEGIIMIVFGVLLASMMLRVIAGQIVEEVYSYNSLEHQVMTGELEDVERILKKGVSPENIRHRNEECNVLADDGEYTLLFKLCEDKKVPNGTEKMQLLIDYGADMNRRACDNGSCYCNCIYCPNWHSTRMKWKTKGSGPSSSKNQHFSKAYKKKKNYNDKCGYTPLMLACNSGNYDAAKLLLENGVDVNATDYCGNTALMYTVNFYTYTRGKEEQVKIAELLLQYGADKNIEGEYSSNVLDAAYDAEWQEMIDVLSQ